MAEPTNANILTALTALAEKVDGLSATLGQVRDATRQVQKILTDLRIEDADTYGRFLVRPVPIPRAALWPHRDT